MEAIQAFVQLGGRVSEREVRDLLGLSEPEDGEAILSSGQTAAPSDNPLAALLGKGNEPDEGEEPAPEAPKVAAVRKRKR
jgi:phage gp29-like protein